MCRCAIVTAPNTGELGAGARDGQQSGGKQAGYRGQNLCPVAPAPPHEILRAVCWRSCVVPQIRTFGAEPGHAAQKSWRRQGREEARTLRTACRHPTASAPKNPSLSSARDTRTLNVIAQRGSGNLELAAARPRYDKAALALTMPWSPQLLMYFWRSPGAVRVSPRFRIYFSVYMYNSNKDPCSHSL